MIKSYTIIGVKCDYCGKNYPDNRSPIHFENEQSANNTVFEDGWMVIVGEGKPSHLCPDCIGKTSKQSNLIYRQDEN